MTIRTFLLGSSLAMIVSWAIWLMVLFWVNPQQAGPVGFVLFFLTVFLAIASTTALAGYLVRRVIAQSQLPAYNVRYSLRQGILLGLLVNGILLLQLARLMRWWLVLILIIIFVSIEFFFVSYDKAGKRYRSAAPKGQ